MAALRTLGINTGWLSAKHMVTLLTGLFVSAWVARYLGPQSYGVLSLAITIAALLRPLKDMGIRPELHRRMAVQHAPHPTLLGTAGVIKAVGALLMLPLALAIGYISGPHTEVFLLMVLLLTLTQAIQIGDIFEVYFAARHQTFRFFLAGLISDISGALMNIALVLSAASLVWFAVAHVWKATILVLVMYAGWVLLWRQWKLGFDISLVRPLLHAGWPIIIAAFCSQGLVLMDKLMLGMLTSTTQVGYYAVAVTVAQAPMFLAQSLATIALSYLVRANTDAHQKIFAQALVLLGIMMTLGLLLLAPLLVRLVFGEDYLPAISLTQILVLGTVFYTANSATYSILTANGSLNPLAWLTGAALALNILLNLVLIPHFAATGAAIASVLALALGYFVFLFFLPNTRPIACKLAAAMVGRYVPALINLIKQNRT